MHTVSVQGLCLAYGARDILLDQNFTITQAARIALSGANGSGKTTLMKILAGIVEPDSGTLQVSRKTVISYLPQAVELNSSHSLYREAERAFDRFLPLLKRQRDIEHQLSSYSPESPPPASLVQEHYSIHQEILSSPYYDRERLIYSVLFGLGFRKQDIERGCMEFSGGWKMRIALARILLESPDILLLDEPTNYLDIDARIWLTGFLQNYHGGVMLVSHDKQFLDDTVTEIFSLYNGRLSRFTGNYSAFEIYQKEETRKIIQAYEQQQKEIERIEQFIDRFRYKASKASQVQSRVTYLEKIQRIEIPPYLKRIGFSFPKPSHSGREIMHLRNISKSYGSLEVIRSLDLSIQRGERIAVTGRNGAGKSTLIRIIAGVDSSFSGERILGKDVKAGYFQQDIDEVLQGTHSVYDEVRSAAPESMIPSVRGLLGAFLFHGDDVFKEVRILSGGEKSRVQLLKLLMQDYNLLVLDEPTNHLDLTSKDILLEALKDYQGTLVYVSHDQAFIRELSEKIIYFSEGPPKMYDGDYDYFLWKISHGDDPDAQTPVKVSARGYQTESKLQHKEQKRLKNRLRVLEAEETLLMKKLEDLEQEVEKIHHLMSLPEHYQEGDVMKQFQSRISLTEMEQEKLMDTWHELNDEITSCREEIE